MDIKYNPEITKITRPSLENYAKKIGAEIRIINKRKYPKMPITYEKFQMYEMAKKEPADWHIFVDADAYICNDFADVVEIIPKGNVLLVKGGFGGVRFKYDNYMRRYGYHLDVGSWFFAVSEWTLDAIKPLHLQSGEISIEEAISNIYPVSEELNAAVPVKPDHLIDDYMLNRNIAKYGLKVSYLTEFFPNAINNMQHTCFDKEDAKLAFLKLVSEWDNKKNWSLLKDHEWKDKIAEKMKEVKK